VADPPLAGALRKACRAPRLLAALVALLLAAAEGSLIASHAYTNKTKATFVRVRARELGEELDHEQEKLHDADAENDDVAADQERAIDIAGQASEQLGQLQSEPDDSEAARAISTRLRELADSASSLGEHL
jgi:uncharacterized membrane protein YccC